MSKELVRNGLFAQRKRGVDGLGASWDGHSTSSYAFVHPATCLTDDAPLLLDVTRLIWRRWKGRLPTGIDRVCLAYLRHFGGRAQAVV